MIQFFLAILQIAHAENLQSPEEQLRRVYDKKETQKLYHLHLQDKKLQKYLDTISNSKLTNHNQALLLSSGIMASPVKKQLISNAKKSILIDTYSINMKNPKGLPDTESTWLFQNLKKALERGVSVHLLVDGFTSNFTSSLLEIHNLEKLGANIAIYNPMQPDAMPASARTLLKYLWSIFIRDDLTVLRNRWHRKAMVIDGKYAVVGGQNWGDSYRAGDKHTANAFSASDFSREPLSIEIGLSKLNEWPEVSDYGWRDTDVLLKGPIVSEIEQDILDSYSRIRKKVELAPSLLKKIKNNPIGNSGLLMRNISQNPFSFSDTSRCDQAYITNFYLKMIDDAKKFIFWGAHALIAMPAIDKALVRAAKRGVKIFLLTNSQKSAKHLPDNGYYYYPKTISWSQSAMNRSSNVHVFEWQSAAYHAKTFIVDGYLTSIGSYNISVRSYCDYSENTVIILDPDFTEKALKVIQNDLKNAVELLPSKEKIPNPTLFSFIFGHALASLGQLFRN